MYKVWQEVLSIDLIERSGVSEATIPNLVDNSFGVGFILAAWSSPDRQHGSSPHTLLVLPCKFPLSTSEELSSPSAFSAKGTGSDLQHSQ